MNENAYTELDNILNAFEIILYAMKWQNDNDNIYAKDHITKEYELNLHKLKTWRVNNIEPLDE